MQAQTDRRLPFGVYTRHKQVAPELANLKLIISDLHVQMVRHQILPRLFERRFPRVHDRVDSLSSMQSGMSFCLALNYTLTILT